MPRQASPSVQDRACISATKLGSLASRNALLALTAAVKRTLKRCYERWLHSAAVNQQTVLFTVSHGIHVPSKSCVGAASNASIASLTVQLPI